MERKNGCEKNLKKEKIREKKNWKNLNNKIVKKKNHEQKLGKIKLREKVTEKQKWTFF